MPLDIARQSVRDRQVISGDARGNGRIKSVGGAIVAKEPWPVACMVIQRDPEDRFKPRDICFHIVWHLKPLINMQ